ncbi:hypothetical protein CKAH01_17633 [Colletotrichum kahawae]|uniref:Uncharacterized protein n=1 Tax=Colletotrichum kahawae TaxID=34407 RepID=A0AAD9YAX9_COLKA|nr:hypothetical protein CKAH01_17633 [Colletotrichum kahawae]
MITWRSPLYEWYASHPHERLAQYGPGMPANDEK